MKALAFLFFLLPAVTEAQMQSNIENAMMKFQRFYNAGQGDSINAMFGRNWDNAKAVKPLWTNEDSETTLQQYGTLQSFTFIGIDKSDPQKVYVFKTVFTKGGEKTTSLTLDNDHNLATFRFITTSKGISRLLKKHLYSAKR